MPTLRQYDAAGRLLPAGADPAKIARSEYEIHIRPGIRSAAPAPLPPTTKGQPARPA
jgi:hypothetical protein